VLTSCAGLGALGGALWLAARDSLRGIGSVVARSTGALGVALIAFASSRAFWLSAVLLVVSGFALMLATASVNTVIQTLVSDRMRGRVMSLYAMAFIGVTPIGSLAGGALATRFGAPWTVAIGGIACVALSVVFHPRLVNLGDDVHRVAASRGVLPEVASGLQTASELRPKT
jgi:MFS family permease